MKWVYHYHLSFEIGERVANIDGIAIMASEILTMEDYREFKKVVEPVHYRNATVRSLTPLKVIPD